MLHRNEYGAEHVENLRRDFYLLAEGIPLGPFMGNVVALTACCWNQNLALLGS
jgi:hypothetical protein